MIIIFRFKDMVMRPCMIYNPGSFGHCLNVVFMLFMGEANEEVVVPLISGHNSLIVQ